MADEITARIIAPNGIAYATYADGSYGCVTYGTRYTNHRLPNGTLSPHRPTPSDFALNVLGGVLWVAVVASQAAVCLTIFGLIAIALLGLAFRVFHG